MTEEKARIPENSSIKGYTFSYDKAGRRTRIHTPEGFLMEETHYQGIRIAEKSSFGETTRYKRDLEGKLLKVQTPEGRSEERSYDALNNQNSVTDGEGNTTILENDLWGRPKKVHLPDGSEETYSYDHEGNIISVKDGRGNETVFEYGIWGITRRIMPDKTSESWEYDKEGRCIKHTDRNGNVMEYSYGLYGNLLSARNRAAGEENTYHYSKDGLLVQAEGGGIRYVYEYDGYGRLTAKKARGRTLLQQGYDRTGRRAWLTDHTGKTNSFFQKLKNTKKKSIQFFTRRVLRRSKKCNALWYKYMIQKFIISNEADQTGTQEENNNVNNRANQQNYLIRKNQWK